MSVLSLLDWSAEGNQQLSWVTQTCATKVVGRVSILGLGNLCILTFSEISCLIVINDCVFFIGSNMKSKLVNVFTSKWKKVIFLIFVCM